MYAVGVEYAHAEARKSPVVDGKVMRNARGREVRYPVILTASEKEMGTVGNASGWIPPSGGTEPGARDTAIA